MSEQINMFLSEGILFNISQKVDSNAVIDGFKNKDLNKITHALSGVPVLKLDIVMKLAERNIKGFSKIQSTIISKLSIKDETIKTILSSMVAIEFFVSKDKKMLAERINAINKFKINFHWPSAIAAGIGNVIGVMLVFLIGIEATSIILGLMFIYMVLLITYRISRLKKV